MTSQIARAAVDFVFPGVAMVAPGWLYLSELGIRCRYGIDRLLAAVGCSLAYLGIAVMVVAYLGIYNRAAGLILVRGPLAQPLQMGARSGDLLAGLAFGWPG